MNDLGGVDVGKKWSINKNVLLEEVRVACPKKPIVGHSIHKNMYLNYMFLFFVSCVKRNTIQNQLVLWMYFFTSIDVIDNLSSNTQHMCPWMQIHMLYFDHRYQLWMHYDFLLGMSVFNIVMRCRPMLHKGLHVDQGAHKWHMAFVC